MRPKTDMKARLGGRSGLFRWGITLTVILFITAYQLGMNSSPAGFCVSDTTGTEVIPTAESAEQAAEKRGPWRDGGYEAEAEGYGGPVRLKVTISNGWIGEVEILDASGEDKPYLRDAKKIIPKVLADQSTDLDAISGATTTCWAILDAIDLALEEAKE